LKNQNRNNLTAQGNEGLIVKKGRVEYFHLFVPVVRRISCPFMVEIFFWR
jgi:hypothetical protein